MRETMKKMTHGATRLLVLALGLGLATTGWADTLRVLGSDATICSSATTLNQLGISMSDSKVAGKINFYTPAGCSAGDKLLFTKVEMLESTGNTANDKQEATNITITVRGQDYTSDLVIKSSTAPSSLGNLTTAGIANCKLLTYNFSNKDVFVEAGEQYDVTFNGANFSQLRCRMENTGSGTVFTSPTSGDWKPYGVITVTPLKSSSPDVGDTILLSNTATSGTISDSGAAECNFNLTIPSTLGIPANSVVRVKKLNLASWNNLYTDFDTTNHKSDPYSIKINNIQSLNLQGTPGNASSKPDIDLTTSKIQGNATTFFNRLSFAYSDNCDLTVGTTYPAATGNNASTGVALLHCNGNLCYGNSTDQAGVRYVTADSASVLSSAAATGAYPIYEMYAEVISIATITNTISAAGTYTLADLFTTVYDNRRYVIVVNESATLNLDAAASVKSITFEVASGKTLTLSGDYAITAADGINVNGGTVAVSKQNALMGAFKGNGTVEFTGVYGTPLDLTSKGVTDSAWQGTLAFKSVSNKSGWQFSQLGNAGSTVRFDGVTDGYFNSKETFDGTVDIGPGGLVLHYGNGSGTLTTLSKLTGSGELKITGGSTYNGGCSVCIKNVDGFTGKLNLVNGANQQITIGDTGSCSQSAKIIIAEGKSVTPSTTWEAYGGIEVNGTLTLNSTIGMPAVAGGAGTIICNQKVPNNDGLLNSTWKGTLKINGDVGPNANTKIGNIASTLEIATGSVTLTAVTSLPGRTVIDSGATLNISNAGVTEFTLGAVENGGTLDLSGCTLLTTLNFDIGKNRTVDLGLYGTTFKMPSSFESVGTVTLVEMPSEGGTIQINSAQLPDFKPTYSITYADGTTLTPISTSVSGSITSIIYTPHISGVATMYDATFNDSSKSTPEFTYKRTSGASIGLDSAVNPKYNNSANDKTTGLYLRHHPYVNGATADIHGLTNFTVVVVGQMSPTHKTQFIHIGSTLNSNKGLLIATTENDDEVIIVPNTGKTVDANNYVKVTVPNAATARHAYVIIKSGNVFTVWVDGIKRGNFTVAAGWEIGSSSHAGVQVGSDFGGAIKDSSDAGKYSAVANSADETGVINLMRIFDYVITDAQAQEIVSEYPYVSEGGLYTRTIAANANLSATDAWAKDGSATTYALPEGATVGEVFYNPSATMTVGADATLTANADLTADTLTVESTGGNTLTVVSDGDHAIHVSGAAVVNSPLSVTYGALDLAGTPVQLGSGGLLHFDCSAVDISTVYSTEYYQLTGLMDRDDSKVTVTLPTAPARTAILNYNQNGFYEMRVTPDHEAGSEVYYKSGYFGKGGDQPFSVVLSDGATPTAVFEGDTVVIDGKSSQDPIYVGELPDNVEAIKIARTCRLASGSASNAMLDGAVVTVADGVVATVQYNYNSITLGDVAFNKVGDSGTGSVAFDNNNGTLSVSGAVTGTAPIEIAAGKTVNVPSTGSIANTVVGDGRIVFEGALPTASALLTSLQNSSSWTGTVELKNYTQTTAVDPHKIINLNNYGNSNSAVALNCVTSTMYAVSGTYPAVTLREIEIGEGGWTDTDNEYSATMLYTANLTGHGPITVKTGYEGTVKFIGDHTFDGSVSFGGSTGKQVAFMKTASDSLPSVTAKAIVVAGRTNMSIASGKKWTADAIKLDGSLTVLTTEKATATSVAPTAYLDGATITTTVDDEAGTTTYVTDTVSQISDNQATLGAVTVSEPMRMTGSGGALMSSLTINDGMTLTYDPVVTPLRVESAPVFNGTGKLKLAARYAGVTRGKFHLVSYPSSASVSGTLADLVDNTSFSGVSYTVTQETVGSYKQLVLKVGDYDTNAKPVSIAQFGDSITEGIWRAAKDAADGRDYRGTPNYRIPLMQLLEAYGYRPEARGYRSVGSTDANGVPADDNYKWHTGISAQRIYTGYTDGSLRAGFMESIEAHLEQVGVTDIITLKIGTNDSLGGETPDNMFEGWTNLVWKIVRMRPTSKIVVCAPVKIMKSGKETSESNAASLRTKIADYVALKYEQGGFPNGQVTMINGFNIVTGDANYYLTDAIHPNWNGHLQLANGWFPAVTNAIESMNGNRAATGYTAQTVASAADAAELETYRAGYVKLATFTNFNAKLSTWAAAPYALVNEAYRTMPMRRVAYFVARKTKASPDTRYVWVDMDADSTTGTTLADFGVPTNASVNGVVNNLHIYSNSSAIENVAPNVSGVRGTLMRTEKGVNKENGISTDLVPNGPYGFDWNDSINASGAWGVMNMARIFAGVEPTNHRKLLAAQMLFDFNGFNGGRQNALGLGDFAVHGPYNTANGSVDHFNLNWTFTTAKDDMPTMDATALETGVIEIWGKPAQVAVSNVAVSYGSDYASAEVTATVSDSTLDYYISWGSGEPVKGTVSGSTVTFDVSGIAHTEPYQSSGYTIAAKDGETAVTTTGGTGSTVAADVVAAGWINENATTHGQAAAGGSWTNAAAVTYTDGAATITDNRFEATTMSTTSCVKVEFNVCFTATSDGDVSGEAQGALKLGEVNSATTFMVLKPNGEWDAVSHGAFTPDPAATYKVVMTFDYANDTYSVSVADNVLTNSSGSASFPLAASRTGVKDIDFAGTGTLVSMKGDQLEGYMVKDNAGGWYATIQAATQAYNSANGPYTVLHPGTAPSGWKIDEATKNLIKVATGLFFMAY